MLHAVIAAQLLASVQGMCADGAVAQCTRAGCAEAYRMCDAGVWGPCTCAAPEDTTPPSVALTAPSNGATVGGTVALSASASDASGVSSVAFVVDGVTVASDTAAPYAATWNSALATNGSHTVAARAYDTAGNVASASATVTVSNLTSPSVACTAPASGSTVSGVATFSADASDADGLVQKVDFRLGGALVATDSASPFSATYDTRPVPNGAGYTLTCSATDSSGLSAEAATTFEIWNQGSVSAPLTNASNAAQFDAAGRLVVFRVSTTGVLYRATETSPGSRTFGTATSMATGIASVSATRDQAGRIVAVATRGSGDLYRWDEPFTTRVSYGGPTTYDGSAHGMTSPVVALQRPDGYWVLIGRGPEGAMYWAEEYAPGTFFPWRSLGGSTYSLVERNGPVAAMASDGTLVVAYLNAYDNGVYVNRELADGSWTGFQRLDSGWGISNYSRSPPLAAIVDATGRVELYYTTRYARQSVPGGAFDTFPLSPPVACTAVAAESHGDRRTVYCHGLSGSACAGSVYYAISNCPGCAFSGWRSLGGSFGPWVGLTALADPLTDRGVLVSGFKTSDTTCAATGGQRWLYGLR